MVSNTKSANSRRTYHDIVLVAIIEQANSKNNMSAASPLPEPAGLFRNTLYVKQLCHKSASLNTGRLEDELFLVEERTIMSAIGTILAYLTETQQLNNDRNRNNQHTNIFISCDRAS
jgi:hypothetical protein